MERAGDPKHKQKLVLRFLIVFAAFVSLCFFFFLACLPFSTTFSSAAALAGRGRVPGRREKRGGVCVPVATLSQI